MEGQNHYLSRPTKLHKEYTIMGFCCTSNTLAGKLLRQISNPGNIGWGIFIFFKNDTGSS
jgi:hypothetical protein